MSTPLTRWRPAASRLAGLVRRLPHMFCGACGCKPCALTCAVGSDTCAGEGGGAGVGLLGHHDGALSDTHGAEDGAPELCVVIVMIVLFKFIFPKCIYTLENITNQSKKYQAKVRKHHLDGRWPVTLHKLMQHGSKDCRGQCQQQCRRPAPTLRNAATCLFSTYDCSM